MAGWHWVCKRRKLATGKTHLIFIFQAADQNGFAARGGFHSVVEGTQHLTHHVDAENLEFILNGIIYDFLVLC